MKSYSFKEYKLISENDYTLIEKFLNNLKINKKEYKKIIILIISNVATQILSLLMVFAKYGCMCMGIKSIIENALQGADFKQATTSGMQYFLIYILLSFYPKLFSMIKF